MQLRGYKLGVLGLMIVVFATIILLFPSPTKATWWNPTTWFTPPAPGTIQGQVAINGTQSYQISIYIDNVAVPNNAGSYSYTTNAVGRNVSLQFSFSVNNTPCPGQSRTANVTKYLAAGATVTHNQNFQVPNCGGVGGGSKSGTITGTVRQVNGAIPVSPNNIVTYDQNGNPTQATTTINPTNGRYTASVRLGTADAKYITVKFNCNPSSPLTNVSVRANVVTPNINFTCPNPTSGGGGGGGGDTTTTVYGSVTGSVYLGSTSLSAGGGITVAVANSPTNTTTTNAAGRYTLSHIPISVYAGQQNQSKSINLVFGHQLNNNYANSCQKTTTISKNTTVSADCTFAVAAAQITLKGTIRISSATSSPAAGARVTVQQGSNIYTAIAGADGTYSITSSALRPGKYNFSVRLDDFALPYTDNNSSLVAGQNNRDVTLMPPSPNTLTVDIKNSGTNRSFIVEVMDAQNKLTETFSVDNQTKQKISSKNLVVGHYNVLLKLNSGGSVISSQGVDYHAQQGENQTVTFNVNQSSPATANISVKVEKENPFATQNQYTPVANVNVQLITRTIFAPPTVISTQNATTNNDGIANINVTNLTTDGYTYTISLTNVPSGYKLTKDVYTSARDIIGGATTYRLLIVPIDLTPYCDNHPTSNLPEFWFCGDTAKNLYQSNLQYWTYINNLIGTLRQEYTPNQNVTPPEFIIESNAQYRRLAHAYFVEQHLPVPRVQGIPIPCWIPPDGKQPYDQSYIAFMTTAFQTDIASSAGSVAKMQLTLRDIVTHEWGHAKDHKEGGCIFAGSSASSISKIADIFKVVTQGSNPDQFFSTINETTYNGMVGGHPEDNTSETYASAFIIGHYYFDKLKTAIAYLSPILQERIKTIVNEANKPRQLQWN